MTFPKENLVLSPPGMPPLVSTASDRKLVPVSTTTPLPERLRDWYKPDRAAARSSFRLCNPEMGIGSVRGDAASAGALYKATLEQVRLVDVLDGIPRLAQSDGQSSDADRSTVELVYDEAEVIAVGVIQAKTIHAL